MWSKIMQLLLSLSDAWKYRGTLLRIGGYSNDFPGLGDSKKLQTWLIPITKDVSALTMLTANTIDDKIGICVERMIGNQKTWDVVYSLLQLANRDRVMIPGDVISTTTSKCYVAMEEMKTENPAMVIAAIGLILQLIQYLKSRKEKS